MINEGDKLIRQIILPSVSSQKSKKRLRKSVKVVRKHEFFVNNASKITNERQRMILTKLLDGFEGNLTSSKYAKIAKTSPDTALRDIKDLVEKGILVKSDSGGRSTNYLLNF